MRVRYCCTISCDVVLPDFIAACMSEMLASNTLNAGAFATGRVTGLAAWLPVTKSRAKRAMVYLMGIRARD